MVTQHDLQRETYTSWRYLKEDSSFGTVLNWFPSRYLKEHRHLVPTMYTVKTTEFLSHILRIHQTLVF